MNSSIMTDRRVAILAGAACVALAQTAPLAAQNRVQSISQAEAAEGAKANEQILQEFGGAMTGPYADYVGTIGKNIAVQSGLSNARDAFKVALLNSSVNNAFAIPGGYIYTTRQLVTLMNNEAELAGVLGHEVGHVAARHGQRRQQAAQRNSILGAIGSILSGVFLGNSQVGQLLSQGIQQGTQLLTLKFSRSQETEADKLGQDYLVKAGYDPKAMSSVLASLAMQNSLDARLQGRGDASIPAWASTHPDPAGRVNTTAKYAGNRTGLTNRDTFLSRIDGMIYGDDPKQGVIEGQRFIHPDLKLTFTAPNGYYMVNGTTAVSVNGQRGQAQLTGAAYSGNLESYVSAAFQQIAGQNTRLQTSGIQRTTVNGIPAAYASARANTSKGQVDVIVFAYEFSPSQAFHFQAIVPAGGGNVFSSMFSSMRRLSANEAGAVVPRRVDVVTVRPGDTVNSLASRMAYTDAQVDRFRVLNGLRANDTVSAGQKVKVVVYSR